MKKKKEKAQAVGIDELLQTDNGHYNNYAQRVATECISGQIFPDVETALQLFGECVEDLSDTTTPLETVQKAVERLSELTAKQKYFILKSAAKFLNPNNTEFDDWELQEQTHEILCACIDAIEREAKAQAPKDTRATLKALVEKEVGEIGQRLERLDDEKRLNIVCKLMPFVCGKAESIEAERVRGNFDWDF